MQAFAEAVILSLVVSVFVASLLFFFYSTAVNGTELPLRLYTQVKRKYREHSRKKRGKERLFFFFFKVPPTTEIYPLSLHDALPI